MRVRSKLIIALSLVIAVAIIPISFYIVNKFEHSSFQKAKEEGEAQSQFFVRSVFNLLLTNGGNIPATRVDAKEVLKIFEGQKAQGLVAMKAIFLSRDKENNGSTLASWPHWIEKESVTELPPTYALRACSDHPQNRCMVFSANMGLSDEAPSLLVSLEYAEAVVLAPIQELKQNLLFAVVIALMLVLILAVLLGFQMTKPLKILEKGTRELAKGNLTYTVALERADEFGELARSFNFMVTSLNRHIEELKEKDRELNAAQTIQRAFLPETLPQSASIGFAAHFTPMAQVGGDLYDVFETGEGYGILIADVSGHGVPAALITGMAKMAVAVRHDLAIEPAQMVKYLNDTLYGHIGSRFLTLIYAYLLPQQKKLTFANGGHPDLLVVKRGTGEVMRFNAQGGMVGVFENQNFSERAILLSSGDRVVFLTDGILEHENETGEMYGTHRLSELFSKTTTIRAEQVCDALIEDMRLFRPSQSMLDDDATVIVLDID